MRTKTLLIAAAALAAGVISSQAQPVYSQNVVGYVNQVVPVGQTLIINPLQNTTNDIEQIMPGLQGGENILIWSTSLAGYYIYNYNPGSAAAGAPSDWIDGGGLAIPGDQSAFGFTWAPICKLVQDKDFSFRSQVIPLQILGLGLWFFPARTWLIRVIPSLDLLFQLQAIWKPTQLSTFLSSVVKTFLCGILLWLAITFITIIQVLRLPVRLQIGLMAVAFPFLEIYLNSVLFGHPIP